MKSYATPRTYARPQLTRYGTVSEMTGYDPDGEEFWQNPSINGCYSPRWTFLPGTGGPGNPLRMACASQDMVIDGVLIPGGIFRY